MRKPPVIHTRFMPWGNFLAITLFGVVFTRADKLGRRVFDHEHIHCRQQLETLYLTFFVWYLLEWAIRCIQYRDFDRAYRNISFEREAYANGDNPDYLRRRRPYAWLRYLRR